MRLQMKASNAVARFGRALIGRRIMTTPYGSWPGGNATIVEINPDPQAPDIVITVDGSCNLLVQAAVEAGELDSAQIGVFDHELIVLEEDNAS